MITKRWTTLLLQFIALVCLSVIEVVERGVRFVDSWGGTRKENIWSLVILFVVLFVAVWFTI